MHIWLHIKINNLRLHHSMVLMKVITSAFYFSFASLTPETNNNIQIIEMPNFSLSFIISVQQ